MDLTFFTNGWSVLALFIICWCVNEILGKIINSITTIRGIRHLKDIPDDQRELLIKYGLNMSDNKKKK